MSIYLTLFIITLVVTRFSTTIGESQNEYHILVSGIVSHITADPYITGNILYGIGNTIYSTNYSNRTIVKTITQTQQRTQSMLFNHIDNDTVIVLTRPQGELISFNRTSGKTFRPFNSGSSGISTYTTGQWKPPLILAIDESVSWADYVQDEVHPLGSRYKITGLSRLMLYDNPQKTLYVLDDDNTLHSLNMKVRAGAKTAVKILTNFNRDGTAISDMVFLDSQHLLFLDSSRKEFITFHLTNFQTARQKLDEVAEGVTQPTSLAMYQGFLLIGGRDAITCLQVTSQLSLTRLPCNQVFSLEPGEPGAIVQGNNSLAGGVQWWIPVLSVVAGLMLVSLLVLLLLRRRINKKRIESRVEMVGYTNRIYDVMNGADNFTRVEDVHVHVDDSRSRTLHPIGEN